MQLATYFRNYAAGNPKHIEELASQLRKHKAITVTGNGRVVVLQEDLESMPLPEKMLGYLRSNLDRLQASFIGRM